jgi:hypothetical protein
LGKKILKHMSKKKKLDTNKMHHAYHMRKMSIILTEKSINQLPLDFAPPNQTLPKPPAKWMRSHTI